MKPGIPAACPVCGAGIKERLEGTEKENWWYSYHCENFNPQTAAGACFFYVCPEAVALYHLLTDYTVVADRTGRITAYQLQEMMVGCLDSQAVRDAWIKLRNAVAEQMAT